MILASNVKEAVTSLVSAKQRTLLALIGIVIGIGSVIAMVTIGRIVQEESLRQFKEMGTDILSIRKDAGGKKEGILDLAASEGVISNCDSIMDVSSIVIHGGTVKVLGKDVQAGSLLGVTQTCAQLNKLSVGKGRFISDLDRSTDFCVLGAGVRIKVEELLKKDCIGENIRIENKLYTIIGVLNKAGTGGIRPFDADGTIYFPISTIMRMRGSNEITNAMIRLKPGVDYRVAQAQLKAYLENRLKLTGIAIQSPEDMIAQMEKQMQMFTLLLGAIGSISLIVGGVGVMNVMLVSVTERRKEIGIRRALGATQGDIKGQFLMESIILSTIGGFIGIFLGVGAAFAAAYFSKWQFMVSFPAIGLGFGVSTVVGVFFGFYPARQASRLDPIVALRS